MYLHYEDILSNYSIKAVVGVDQPRKAVSLHIKKPFSVLFLSKIVFDTKFLHAYFQCVSIVKAKYQIAPLKKLW